MNEEELKRLVQKYYDGTATDEEEKILRDFFRRNNVPRGYEAEKEIFGYYIESADIPEPSNDFEAQIIAAVSSSDGRSSNRRFIYTLLSAAAGILILTGAYFFFTGRQTIKDTYSDPEIAYVETIKILHQVSYKLNQGVKNLEPVGKLNRVGEKNFSSAVRVAGKQNNSL
jgi:hypothetical protein